MDAWSKDRILSASGLQLPPITTPLPWSYHAKMRARTRSGRLRRAERQRFTLSDVIERDGWRCGICGKTVDPRAKGRDRKSLDHVIPICMGGSHTLANAQLAHLGCNSRKGARLSLRAAGGDAIVSLTQTEGN